MRSLAIALLALVLGGCGPSSQLLAVAIASHEDGAGNKDLRASVVAVDAGSHSGASAVEATGVSVSQAPEALIPLAVCRKIAGGPRGSTLTGFKILDTGPPTLKTADGKHSVTLGTASPSAGKGTAYAGTFSPTDMPFDPGSTYEVNAGGGNGGGPSFGAKIQAPPDFDVKKIGFSTPGPGYLSIPTQTDLEVDWSPSASGTEMWILLSVGDVGLACRAADNGTFVVPQGVLDTLPKSKGTLTVERYFQADFQGSVGQGSGSPIPGHIRFAVQREYQVQLQ